MNEENKKPKDALSDTLLLDVYKIGIEQSRGSMTVDERQKYAIEITSVLFPDTCQILLVAKPNMDGSKTTSLGLGATHGADIIVDLMKEGIKHVLKHPIPSDELNKFMKQERN